MANHLIHEFLKRPLKKFKTPSILRNRLFGNPYNLERIVHLGSIYVFIKYGRLHYINAILWHLGERKLNTLL